MKISEVSRLLDAIVVVGQDRMECDLLCACGADLMSDVLAFVKHDALLLTGLVNPHVLRTAEMMDISCIVFVRGKYPPEDVIEDARERGMVILTTQHTMFTACGILYKNGLPGNVAAES